MAEVVAITGLGVLTALGGSPSALWDALLAGRSGIGPLTDFETSGFTCPSAALVVEPSPDTLGVSPRESRVMTLPPMILLQAGQAACLQTRMKETGFSSDRIAFFAAMGLIDPHYNDLKPAVLKSGLPLQRSESTPLSQAASLDFNRFLGGAYQEIYPLWPLAMLNNVGFCLAANQLGVSGENAVFSADVDAGVMALAEGVESLRSQKADLALVGGTGEKMLPMHLARMQLLFELSPQGICRPLSPLRNGTVPGEGGAVLALEPIQKARARGVVPLAVITGWGFGGGTDRTAAHKKAMNSALERAGCRPGDISLLMPHGDGTSLGDEAELTALAQVFKDRRESLPVYVTKASLGHLRAGAAVVDALVAALILHHRTLPPMIDQPDPTKGIFWETARAGGIPFEGKKVLINARGWSGACASLILERGD
jgi:3-oxoacyl-[acyl-carrier-protein] synthase II